MDVPEVARLRSVEEHDDPAAREFFEPEGRSGDAGRGRLTGRGVDGDEHLFRPIGGVSGQDLILAVPRSVPGPPALVAQSLGGFSVPLVCADIPVQRLVLAMVPRPSETAGEWWDSGGWQAAAQDRRSSPSHGRWRRGRTSRRRCCAVEAIGSSRSRYSGGSPRSVSVSTSGLPGGHLLALSQPMTLADRLTAGL